MGTSYRMDGEIRIEPPLNYEEIQKAREVAMGLLRNGWDQKNALPLTVFEGYMALKPEIEEGEENTPRGVLLVRTASRLIPSHGEGSLSYSWETLVSALVKALPGHNWKGEVTALHEDAHEAYKLVVDANPEKPNGVRQVRGTAYIKWDDDSGMDRISDLQ
jgi:hypothetical protein